MFIQFILIAVSITLFVAGFLKYDLYQFIGVRQIISGRPHSTLTEDGEIVTSGILGITRHPWYAGGVIFVWICYRDMYLSTLIVNVLLTIYLIIGTALEEKKLLLEFGSSYRDYKKRVSMLFPFKWILSRF